MERGKGGSHREDAVRHSTQEGEERRNPTEDVDQTTEVEVGEEEVQTHLPQKEEEEEGKGGEGEGKEEEGEGKEEEEVGKEEEEEVGKEEEEEVVEEEEEKVVEEEKVGKEERTPQSPNAYLAEEAHRPGVDPMAIAGKVVDLQTIQDAPTPDQSRTVPSPAMIAPPREQNQAQRESRRVHRSAPIMIFVGARCCARGVGEGHF